MTRNTQRIRLIICSMNHTRDQESDCGAARAVLQKLEHCCRSTISSCSRRFFWRTSPQHLLPNFGTAVESTEQQIDSMDTTRTQNLFGPDGAIGHENMQTDAFARMPTNVSDTTQARLSFSRVHGALRAPASQQGPYSSLAFPTAGRPRGPRRPCNCGAHPRTRSNPGSARRPWTRR